MCKFVFIMSRPAPPYPTLPQGNPSQGTQQTLATKQQSNSIHIKHLLNRFCVTPPSAPQPLRWPRTEPLRPPLPPPPRLSGRECCVSSYRTMTPRQSNDNWVFLQILLHQFSHPDFHWQGQVFKQRVKNILPLSNSQAPLQHCVAVRERTLIIKSVSHSAGKWHYTVLFFTLSASGVKYISEVYFTLFEDFKCYFILLLDWQKYCTFYANIFFKSYFS